MKNKALSLILATFLGLGISSCAKVTQKEREERAINSYQAAILAYTNGDYSKAAHLFKRALKYLENLTPTQIENARYLLAKSYYLDKDYTNAIVELESFLFYYPAVPQVQEVEYMLISSYEHIAPDAYRDQTYTYKAIEMGKEFLSKYPNSPYANKVNDIILEAKKKIVEHDILIAKFYKDYGYYYPAAERYKDILINYPEYVPKEQMYYNLIKCLFLVPKQAKDEIEKYEDLYKKDEKKLKKAKEDKPYLERRAKFWSLQVKRWKDLQKQSYEEGKKYLNTFISVYGEIPRAKELQKLEKESAKWIE